MGSVPMPVEEVAQRLISSELLSNFGQVGKINLYASKEGFQNRQYSFLRRCPMDPETAMFAFRTQHPDVKSVHRLEHRPGWMGVTNNGELIYEAESDLRYFIQEWLGHERR
jgi:hypothetical protein